MNPTAIRDLMLRDPEFRTILGKRGGKQDRPTEAQLRDALRAWAEHGGEGLGERLSLPDATARERVRTALRRGMRVRLAAGLGGPQGGSQARNGDAQGLGQPAEIGRPGGVQALPPVQDGPGAEGRHSGSLPDAKAPQGQQVLEGLDGRLNHEP